MPIKNKKAGLYMILKVNPNKPNSPGECFYVGSSTNLNRRFTEHKRDLKTGKHKNPRLQQVWNDSIKSLLKPFNSYVIDEIFPHIGNYLSYKDTSCLVFIPILEILMTSSLESEQNLIKKELESLERNLESSIQNNLSVPPLNYWLVLGTSDRVSTTVCIEGKIYTNRSVAAEALGLFKNGKPDKQYVLNRIGRKTYSKWCYISNSTLMKKVGIRNSKGKLLKYELLECGKVENIGSDSVKVIYYDKPTSLGFLPLQRDAA